MQCAVCDLVDDDANDEVSGYGPRDYIPRRDGSGERLSNVAPPPVAVRKVSMSITDRQYNNDEEDLLPIVCV